MKNGGIESVLGQQIDRRHATICQLSLGKSGRILMLALASHPLTHLNILGNKGLG
jgi:hypothetical protein